MKNFKFLLWLPVSLLAFCIPGQAYGQVNTNVDALNAFSAAKHAEWQMKRAEAEAWAIQNNQPIRYIRNDGKVAELQAIYNGKPLYFMEQNVNAAATISTNDVLPGGSTGLNLSGTGIILREWDGGGVRTTHQELTGRVTQVDNPSSLSGHSTHVAGTMIASGVSASAKGMAPEASLRAFDWNSDEGEMASEGALGALMSNSSYGFITGWYYTGSTWVWYGDEYISDQEDWWFGFYSSYSRDRDQIAYDAPYYLIVKSAGNDRGDGPTNGAYPQDGPYDCIGTVGVAKNIMTVGAVNDIPSGYSGPSSVVMSSFSSWGPADDGRIKPDIVANGITLYSCYYSNDISYATGSGTSMSSPSVTGSLALLQEHYENLNNTYMRAATLKALVIATADEAGNNPGPDYEFGWGLMNTAKAAQKITEDQTNNVIDELVLANGQTYTRDVYSDGQSPIKVTIVWTDPPGTPVSASLDPITPMLVNDLDLRISFGTNTYYPWKLDRNNPSNAATNTTENNVDNVEVVYIAAPAAGVYTITIDHDGSLYNSSQAFSIVLDGVQEIFVLPVADFSASSTNIYVGETVNFTDLSTGNPTTWSWDFDNNEGTSYNSTTQNPSITFNVAGTYDVMLYVSNLAGNDTETKLAYINVSEHPPIADFTSDVTHVVQGNDVQFQDLSQYDPTAWSWSFPGGTPSSSTLQNPVVTYSSLGTYDVTLTAIKGSLNDTETKTGYIHVTDGSISYCQSNSLDFTDDYIANVTIGNLNNTSGGTYYSDFTAQTLQLQPALSYSFTLSPWKSNPSRKESWRIWIDYNIDGDFNDAGEEIFSTNGKRNPVNGTFTVPTGVSGMTRMRVSMEPNVTSLGPCDILAKGEVEDYSVEIANAVPQAPVANFSANTTEIDEGQQVSFTDLSANNPTSWSWTFEGGNPPTSTAQNPTVSYAIAGIYDVTLIASNTLGSDIELKTDYITVNEPGAISYCISESQSNDLEWIGQVQVGSFTNPSGASFYTDFTGLTVNLTPGNTEAVLLTPVFTGKDQREFWRIWIDYNADGDFEDSGETVFIANNKKTEASGSFIVPSSATGQTRMRVTMKNGASPSPCEVFANGEVEDYKVSFSSPNMTSAEVGELEFLYYPNPAGDQLNLMISGAKDEVIITLFTLTGQLVEQFQVENGISTLYTGHFSQGMYYIRLQSGETILMKKLFVQ